MDGNALLAKILKDEGTEYLFCFPHNSLIDACAKEGIRPIIARTERTIIGMADGYARTLNGDKPAVVATQQGPGTENAFPGIAQAFADSVPIMFVPGGEDRSRYGLNFFFASDNYKSITKWLTTVHHTDRIQESMQQAFTRLRMGKPGPILVEFPINVGSESVNELPYEYSAVKSAKTASASPEIEEAVRLILSANNPIIHAGQGVLYANASAELKEFAELINSPVMTTLTGKSAFPEDHPLALGTGGISAPGAVYHFIDKADLVLGVGCSFTRNHFNAQLPKGKTVIQITNDAGDINHPYPVTQAVLGDAKIVLQQLIEETKIHLHERANEKHASITAEITEVKKDWINTWMPRLTSSDIPINPYRVVWELNNLIDHENSIVTHDSGSPRDQMVPFYDATVPRSYIGWGHSTQLGYGLPLALGAKLADPEKLVVNVMGDTAFGTVGMEFETAVRERIPILTILLNNSSMGGYINYMPYSLEHYGASRLTGNYSKVAEALGGYSEVIEDPKDFSSAFRRAEKVVSDGTPALLEVITKEDYFFSNNNPTTH